MPLASLRILAFINGIFLVTLAVAMLVPVITLLIFEQPQGINAFLWSSMIAALAGIAMMLMAPTEQELAALLRPVLELIPIPGWCSVLRRISADNAIMTQPAAPALPG